MRYRPNYSRIGAKEVTFDGVRIPQTFIVDEVLLEIFPEIISNSVKIPGRAGQHYQSGDFGIRHGSLRLSANTAERKRIKSISTFLQLTDFLKTTEPKKLQLGDFYVYAKFVEASSYEQVGIYGSISLDFECYDSKIYYGEHRVELKQGTNTFMCNSAINVYPYFVLSPTSTNLRIVNPTTSDQVVVPEGVSSTARVTVDMNKERCESNGNYLPVDNNFTDFFPLVPGKNTINLVNATGYLTYEECRL